MATSPFAQQCPPTPQSPPFVYSPYPPSHPIPLSMQPGNAAGPPVTNQHQSVRPSKEMLGSLYMEGQIRHFAKIDNHQEDINGKKMKAEDIMGKKMRQIALDVWKLKEPKVLLSVTGGALDFSMGRKAQEKFFQGLVHVAAQTDAWFITGGTDAGIMKYVGEARNKYAANSPLIGIATWGVLAAQMPIQKAFQDENPTKLPGTKPINISRDEPQEETLVHLNKWHTHFFLIDDLKKEPDFGHEIPARAAFEKKVSEGQTHREEREGKKKQVVDLSSIFNYDEWTKGRFKRDELVPNTGQSGGENDDPNPDKTEDRIPIVCICLQGGPGSAGTVLAAAKAHTPVLLIKGSGKTSELMGDILLWSEVPPIASNEVTNPLSEVTKPKRNGSQKLLFPFLEKHGGSGKQLPKIVLAINSMKDSLASLPDNINQVCLPQSSDQGDLIVILKSYFGENQNKTQAVKAFIASLEAVETKMCTVFDLHHDEDMEGKILQCLHKSMENAKPELHGAELFEKKLIAAVDWNDPKVLTNVIKTTFKDPAKCDNKDLIKGMNAALHRALLLERHDAVDFLINNGATEDQYSLLRARDLFDTKNGFETNEKWDEKWKGEDTPDQWDSLMKSWNDKEDPLRLWYELIKSLPKNVFIGSKYSTNFEDKLSKLNSCYEKTFKPSGLEQPDSKHFQLNSCYEKTFKPSGLEQPDSIRKFKDFELMHLKLIVDFEQFVKELCGEAFTYHMGVISPEFDLMVWSALKNQRSMTYVWWKEYMYPIRSALTICRLSRQLAKQPGLTPSDQMECRGTANFFEQLAIEVQKIGKTESYHHSTMSLENPLRLWKNWTIVDVAVFSGSEIFVEKCCREAIERRFAGDILPYSQRFPILHVQELRLNVFFNVITLGLFVPWLINLHSHPDAENLRYPTQRRKVPDDDTAWRSRTRLFHPETIGRLELEGHEASSGSTGPAWGDYLYKWWLFWQAPVSLFYADSVILAFMVIFFSWFLFSAPDPSEIVPWEGTSNPIPDQDRDWDWPVFKTEVFLAAWFVSRALSEVMQWFLSSGLEYWTEFWNVLDFGSSVCFFVAFSLRFFCSSNGDQCVGLLWTDSVPIDRLWAYLYSISLFLLWARLLRVLSVSPVMGPLVILIRISGQDILRFALVWFLLLMGFSVLIRGSTEGVFKPACLAGEDHEGPIAACWRGWWIVRTFVQGVGAEVWMEDMTTDAALLGVMLLFIVMNILLLNLLIAIMSQTYGEIQEKSERKYLVDLHGIVNEYTRRSVAAPTPFNWIFIFVDLAVFFIKKQKVNTVWSEHGWRKKLDLYLRRNLGLDELYLRKVHRNCEANVKRADETTDEDETKGKEEEKKILDSIIASHPKKLEELRLGVELELFWQAQLDAFLERSREIFKSGEKLEEIHKEWEIVMTQHGTLMLVEHEEDEEAGDVGAPAPRGAPAPEVGSPAPQPAHSAPE